ncbi:MAG: PAS domain S-box protein [Aeromonadaceae bacterium]
MPLNQHAFLLRWSLLATVSALLAYLCIQLSLQDHELADIWLANATGLAFLLRSEPLTRPWLLTAHGLGNLLAYLLSQTPLPLAIGFSLINMLEIGMALWVLKAPNAQIEGAAPLEAATALRTLLRVILLALPPSALLGGLMLSLDGGSSPAWPALHWWWENSLGMAMLLLPCLQLGRSHSPIRRDLLWGGSCLGISVITLLWIPFPFPYLAILFTLLALNISLFAMGVTALATMMLTPALLEYQQVPQLAHAALISDITIHSFWSAGTVCSLLAQLVGLLVKEAREKSQSIAASERRLRSILDLAATGFALCTPEGKLTEVNPYLCRKLGYSRDELLEMNIKELTLPEEWQKASIQLDELRRGVRDHYTTERRYLSKEGRELTCLLNVSLLHNHHAEDELIIHVDDISERRADELQIRRLNERLQLACRANRMGIWDFNLQDGTLIWDEHMYQLFQVPEREREHNYQMWQNCVHPDDLAATEAVLQQAIQQCQEFEYEFRILWPDGSVHHIQAAAMPLIDEHGKTRRMVGMNWDITASRQAEAQLKASERRLQLALESARAGAWEWQVETNQQWWSDELYRLIGYQADELTASYENWLALVYEEDKPELERLVQQMFREKRGYNHCYRVRCGDGHLIWIDDRVLVELDEKGKLQRLRGVSQDITPQKQIEQALRESQARLQAILDSAVDAIITINQRGLVESFNPAAERMFGYQAGEVIGKNVSLLMPEPQRSHHNDYLHHHAESGEKRLLGMGREVNGRHKSGLAIPLELSINEVQVETGTFYTGFLHDISERKRSEQELIAAQQQLQGVIDAASEIAIIATDTHGTINLFNSGAERMLGYAASEMINRETPAIIHLQDEVIAHGIELSQELGYPVNGFDVFIARARHGGYEVREWTYVHKSGRHLTVLLAVTAIKDAQGKIIGYLGIAKEIGELKRIQNALALARDEAERASRAKSEFLANMSHEIRTPLNAVLGITHLLGNTPLAPQQQKYLQMITQSGRSLLGILNDILDFSKIEAGRLELANSPFDLNEVMDSLASIMSVNAAEKSLELTLSIEPQVPRQLIGDNLRLQQILINLVGNAIKFTNQGEVGLHVTLEQQTAEQAWLTFKVKDSGIGISLEQQAKLFAPFTQADSSTTRRFGGTGLGLAICKRLVDMMGGTLGVQSQPGEGSCFWFTLPLQLAAEQIQGYSGSTELKGLRLLLVDEGQNSCTSLQQAAATLGWQLQCASRLPELTPELCAGLDLLLVSWPVSQHDLPTLLAILADTVPTTLPIILVTTIYYREKVLAQPHAERLDSILLKPATSSSLHNAVIEAKSHHGGGPMQLLARLPQLTSQDKPLKGVHLLLVEDNELNQLVARHILEQAGATLDAVENGQLAVDRLQSCANLYDLVLMDVQMPVMDGYTATRILRHQLHLTLPVLAITAGVMSSERQQCLESGMNDVIAKPLEVQRLLQSILMHLPSPSHKPDSIPEPQEAPERGDSFNPEQLIQQLGGDELLLSRLIEPFLHETDTLLERLNKLLTQGAHEDAARMLHTLKGHAATFGAQLLASEAKRLELAVRRQDHSLFTEAQPAFSERLHRLREDMQLWLNAKHQLTMPLLPPVPNAQCQIETPRQLQQLKRLLREQNFAAEELFARLQPELIHLFPAERLKQIGSAIESFDFAAALLLLELDQPN